MNKRVESLKPKAKNIMAIASLTITPDTTVQIKADGECCLLTYEKGVAYTVNRWDTKRDAFPALTEFVEAVKRTGFEKVELLVELYGVDENGRMVMLPILEHILKGLKDFDKVRIGVHEVISINDKPVNQSYKWRIQEAEMWLQGCSRVQVLPYICPKTIQEVEDFWRKYVDELGYEGLMVHQDGEIYKLKRHATVDCAVVGINKRSKIKDEEVTSLKLALMDEKGLFVELGDVASGIDLQLRKVLWGLTEYKVYEDSETIWIGPNVVAEIEYTQTFEADMRLIQYADGKICFLGYRKAHSLRHPRLLGFRKDKRVIYEDLRFEQL